MAKLFQILNEAKLFYEHLYSCEDSQLTDINLHDLLLNTETEKLSTQESNLIEGSLTYKEAGLTLKAMQNNDVLMVLVPSSLNCFGKI